MKIAYDHKIFWSQKYGGISRYFVNLFTNLSLKKLDYKVIAPFYKNEYLNKIDPKNIDGKNIETIEGMATPEGLHPLQQAFLEEAALQCGICTPGFLVASKNLLDNEPNPSEGRIRHWLSGNLCRCTGYDKIVKAVQKASDKS